MENQNPDDLPPPLEPIVRMGERKQRILLIVPLILMAFTATMPISMTPQFKRIFEAMLEGGLNGMPMPTAITVEYAPVIQGMIVAAVVVGAVSAFLRNYVLEVIGYVLSASFLAIINVWVLMTFWMPLIKIIQRMDPG